jgi:glycogen operon protein
VNFVTCHDGFTLRDLASYNDKHNDANGEDNHDGTDDNISWNHGAEGDTDDPNVLSLRHRTLRNFLATLLMSQGVPMIVAGDEFGRTQGGNNNAYCQDNEVSWVDWRLERWQQELLRFTRMMIRLRKEQPVFRRRRFFEGRNIGGSDQRDALWLLPEGGEIGDEQWREAERRAFGLMLNGDAASERDDLGELQPQDTLLALFNSSDAAVDFALPPHRRGWRWHRVLDTTLEQGRRLPRWSEAAPYPLQPRSLAVLRLGRRRG